MTELIETKAHYQDMPERSSDLIATEPADVSNAESLPLFEGDIESPSEVKEKVSAREVAERLLAWASSQHMLDSMAVVAQSAEAEGPQQENLFPQGSGTIQALRQKQVAGTIYDDSSETVHILLRRKLSAAAIKTMPGWHNNVAVRYLHFGIAFVGGPMVSSNDESYREVNGRYACGSSIHPARYPGAGTLGCLVRDANGKIYGLSANHVTGLANYSDIGEKILAPGHSDILVTNRDPFTIGVHVRGLPFHHGSPANVTIEENTDAAIFEIRDPDALSSSQGGYYDTPSEVADPVSGMRVEKVGRTTVFTTGRIVGASPAPVAVSYQLPKVGGNATVYFNNIFVVTGTNGEPFSLPGDSGSLVCSRLPDGTDCAVGILIAGTNADLSLILPIKPILEQLNMTLVSNHYE